MKQNFIALLRGGELDSSGGRFVMCVLSLMLNEGHRFVNETQR
jgi:hypothetical protein